MVVSEVFSLFQMLGRGLYFIESFLPFCETCMKHLQVPIESCQDSYVVDDNGNGMH